MIARSLALASLAGLLALAAGPVGAQDASGHKVYAVAAQNGSGEIGTVTLVPLGTKTRVEVAIAGTPDGVAQPAHIHEGTCDKLNPKPKYPLSSVVDGTSTTTVDVPMSTLIAGGFAVNVHKSSTDIATYGACGILGK